MPDSAKKKGIIQMTTIEKMLIKMQPGKNYSALIGADISDTASIRAEIARAARMGLLSRQSRGVYQITPKGLACVQIYTREVSQRLSRANIYDVPWIAWPV